MRTSFWFVPSIMALLAALASVGTTTIDSHLLGSVLPGSAGWLWSGGAEGARSLLSTVASSMITVAGTVFSITIAALTLASSQFGPRLLRNFTRDTGNQVVLGTFVATFIYCLLVLRTIRTQNEGGFVPNLSVTCGVLLAVASLGVLIYFIHHVASSIQAESLIANIGAELKQDIGRLYAAPKRQAGENLPLTAPGHDDASVHASASGYVQAIDVETLADVADEHGLLVGLIVRPGDFVSHGEPLLRIRTTDGALSDSQSDRLRGAFSLGSNRTPTQDIRYGIRQLTEIAARALSPGINDPFTTMGCCDWLADALGELARCTPPAPVLRNESGTPLVITNAVGFAELATLGFDPIRAYGANSAMVMIHLLGNLAKLVEQVTNPDHRRALLWEAEQAAAAARLALASDNDMQRIEEAMLRVRLAAGTAIADSWNDQARKNAIANTR